MRDESELAGLLAHEVTHVVERHGVRAIESSYRTKVIVSGLGEATAGSGAVDPKMLAVFGDLAEEATETLLTKGLSRKVELNTDKAALDLLWRAGYDPEGLVRFLDHLAAPGYESRQPTLMRTHPKPEQRATKAGRALAAMDGGPRPEARFAQLFSDEVAAPAP
jgi:predicted Zn-dependent protease